MRRRRAIEKAGAGAIPGAGQENFLRTVLCGVAAVLASSVCAFAAEDLAVDVARQGDGRIAVHAHAKLRASRETVWRTLTDYGDFKRFVPGLDRSQVVSCAGGQCVVDQDWHLSILWFSLPIAVTVKSVERPPGALEVHLLKGDLKQLDGGYEIGQERDGQIELRWEGTLEGPERLPGWLSAAFVRRMAREQFRGMVTEIESRENSAEEGRRQSLKAPAAGP